MEDKLCYLATCINLEHELHSSSDFGVSYDEELLGDTNDEMSSNFWYSCAMGD